jgi:hypothetical protein
MSIKWRGMSGKTRFYMLNVSLMTYEEMKRRLDALAREYLETHNPEIAVELYFLARELEKIEKQSLN